MVCKICGEMIEDGLEICPVCGCRIEQTEESEPKKTPSYTKQESHEALRLPESAALAAAFVVGVLSFLLNVIIGAFMFAKHATSNELLFLFPPFAALILGVYGFYKARARDNAVEKMISFIAMGLALFAILFLFVAYCYLLA